MKYLSLLSLLDHRWIILERLEPLFSSGIVGHGIYVCRIGRLTTRFRFLSTSVGVKYLHEIEFIEREMEHWFHVGSANSDPCLGSANKAFRPLTIYTLFSWNWTWHALQVSGFRWEMTKVHRKSLSTVWHPCISTASSSRRLKGA